MSVKALRASATLATRAWPLSVSKPVTVTSTRPVPGGRGSCVLGLGAEAQAESFRKIYVSPPFVTSSFAHAHDLEPALAAKIRQCFLDYRFSPEMTKEFLGDDRFRPVSYKDDWALVRKVAEDSGTPYNRAGYDKERAAEEAARAKKK